MQAEADSVLTPQPGPVGCLVGACGPAMASAGTDRSASIQDIMLSSMMRLRCTNPLARSQGLQGFTRLVTLLFRFQHSGKTCLI